MKWVVKMANPPCMETLRMAGASYEDLREDCREVVVKQLTQETKGFCAYCEKSLHHGVFIEHYLSQHQHPSLALAYQNLLAVCSGKFYLDRMTGKYIPCCDTSKGDQEVTVDPRSEIDMAKLYYDENGKLRANCNNFQDDIDQVLRLNFEELCDRRMVVFEEFYNNVTELWPTFPKNELLKKALGSLERNPPEYSSYVKYCILNLFKPSAS